MEGEKLSVFTFACGCVIAHRCVNSLMSVFRVHGTHYGPYLESGAIYLITGVVASLQLAQSVLFPPAPRIGKIGNDLAPQGAVR